MNRETMSKLVDRLLEKEFVFLILIATMIIMYVDGNKHHRQLENRYDKRIEKLEMQMIQTQQIAAQCQADMVTYMRDENRKQTITIERATRVMEKLEKKLKE